MIDLDELWNFGEFETPSDEPWTTRCNEETLTILWGGGFDDKERDQFERFISAVNSLPDLIKLARWAERAKVAIERNIEGDYEYFLTDVLKDYPQVEGE